MQHGLPDGALVGPVVCLCGDARGGWLPQTRGKSLAGCAHGATAPEDDVLMVMKMMLIAVSVPS